MRSGPILIYATSAPEEVKAVQRELGAERAGALVEEAFAAIGKRLVAAGVRKLIVAGEPPANFTDEELIEAMVGKSVPALPSERPAPGSDSRPCPRRCPYQRRRGCHACARS